MESVDAIPALKNILDEVAAIEAVGGSAPMLPRGCYTSPEFFEFERETVFATSWMCVGRVEQIPEPGHYLATSVAGEPILVVRNLDDGIHVMSAVCQHRGHVLTCESGSTRRFRCPLHSWSYDLSGNLLGAPRMGSAVELERLKKHVKLPSIRHELWHGFIFVNLDDDAHALAPTLAKLESFWANYEDADLVAVPPAPSERALPWNWKVHFENFTDAYHPEFVHRGTHDFAPSIHPAGGVEFTGMAENDNAIVRSVPLLRSDGGMMRDGWGESAAFPPIETLAAGQRKRLTFAILPPSMTMVFAPNAIAYALISPMSADSIMAASDRVSGGGWLIPRSTAALPDFAARGAQVREGGGKIFAQDHPVNVAMQAGKRSRFMPEGIYGPLETTLVQFNAWLMRAYRKGLPPRQVASILKVAS